MSYRRRRVRDDLVDVVYDVIRNASEQGAAPLGDEAAMRAQADREAARQAARLEKQRAREASAIRQYAAAGAGLLAGGLASILLPTVAAVGIGLLTGGAMSIVVRAIQNGMLVPGRHLFPAQQKPRAIDPPEVDGRDIPKSQRDVVQGVLDESAVSLRKLDAASRALAGKDEEASKLCRRIVTAGERLSDAVADEPVKFTVAQRVLTYHLPKAVFVAETFQGLEPEHYDKRAAEARHLLTRMEMVFEKAILDMSSVDAAEMDLEMRLINQALDEDLNSDKAKS